ncbi:RNA 2'-phosphotransferase [Halomicrobium salinisoli]|uniref:RNA 2'-phosphotransferase n=1 Tax=Halomicrobium salinisoli TaxID=2878391 RepID=UPI001CF07781|nr:RNA 2'-phosphotransferase [Halomicrobium salinisoli]
MTAPIRACDEHGFFEGDACPACEQQGETVLSGERRRRLSKFASGALRHFPDDAGIELDDAGWTAFDDLADAVAGKYDWAGPRDLAAVIETDPKGRFEWSGADGRADDDSDPSGGRVRAAYGHSVDVDLGAADTPVPDTLYHGTAPRNVDAIREEGLRPMSRQTVHLSGTVGGAREVGSRHADDPVVFAVDAAAMERDGRRVVKRGRATYTTDRVPPEYLELLEE